MNGVAFASFIASGQTCVSGSRILVQNSIYEQFMDMLLKKIKNITERIGDRKLLSFSFLGFLCRLIQM